MVLVFNAKISILTGHDELFNELYADALSDCSSDFEIYYSDVEIDNLSDIRLPKWQICKTCSTYQNYYYCIKYNIYKKRTKFYLNSFCKYNIYK